MESTIFSMTERVLRNNTDIIKIGPTGLSQGNSWDEKGCCDIVRIFVSHDNCIQSLQFQYCKDGDLVLSDRHGKNTANNFEVVKFDHPMEYLTCIRGSYDPSEYFGGLKSITFTTNVRTYGPIGELSTEYEFRFQLGEDCHFYGFFGLADSQIRSIGVYIMPNKKQNQCGCPVSDELI